MSAFVSWNKQFYTWIASSPFGKQEVTQSNNHGTFADMQLAAIALFVGDKAGATTIANTAKSERIDVHYSNFDLVVYTRLAQIASQVGVDLWSYTGAKGQSIMKAVDFIARRRVGRRTGLIPSWGSHSTRHRTLYTLQQTRETRLQLLQ